MTSVCPRCRTPLSGPACTACGARFDVPPGAPPVSAYVPPPMYPSPYMMYQPMPYPVAPVRRGKGMAMPGGIMSIITGAIVLAMTVASLSKAGFRDHGSVLGLLIVCLVLGIAGVLFGIYAIKARWWACLIGGIAMTVTTVMGFAFIGVVESIKKEHYRSYDYYDYSYGNTPDYGGMSSDDFHTLEALAGGFFLLALISLIAAIFCYIGVASSKAYERHQKHLQATEQF